MRSTLFRTEAVEHHRPTLVGAALNARPLSFPLLTGAAAVLAGLVVLFGSVGEYTRKARVSGYLAPSAGLIKVYAPAAGTLIEKRVAEGQRVKKGDVLFVVSTDPISGGEPQAQAAAIEHIRARLQRASRERQAQLEIESSETAVLQDRVRSMETELDQLDASIRVQTQRAETARATAESYRAYFERHLLTRLDLERAEADALEQLGRQHELQRARTALLRELEEARAALQTMRFASEKRVAELERQELSLQQELTESDWRRVQVITAPIDGTATAIVAEQGASANPQVPLLAILPSDATLQAQLLAPSRAIGSIAVGDRVSLRYQAFPYQQYGVASGVITEISKTLLSSSELDGPIRSDEPVYRVTVALASQTMTAGNEELPLRAGMLLDADIWLERRRLIAWLFDPLNQLTRSAR